MGVYCWLCLGMRAGGGWDGGVCNTEWEVCNASYVWLDCLLVEACVVIRGLTVIL